jgi:threonine/homoserine/homoserine lactone efflux protein
VLTLGVFAGSMLWWMLLAGTVSALRKRVSRGAIVWVNRASGLLLGIFGVYVLADAFFAR